MPPQGNVRGWVMKFQIELDNMDNLNSLFESYSKQLADYCNNPILKLDFSINCRELTEKYIYQDIRDSAEFSSIFNQLSSYNDRPCIYWFDSQVKLNGTLIHQLFKSLQSNTNYVIPALDKKPHNDSCCLYVGKVKSNIEGRLIQHLGVHKDQGRAHGLQLVHWIHDYPEDVNLSYHVVPFPNNEEWRKMAMLFEYALADKLKPIIGHHNG